MSGVITMRPWSALVAETYWKLDVDRLHARRARRCGRRRRRPDRASTADRLPPRADRAARPSSRSRRAACAPPGSHFGKSRTISPGLATGIVCLTREDAALGVGRVDVERHRAGIGRCRAAAGMVSTNGTGCGFGIVGRAPARRWRRRRGAGRATARRIMGRAFSDRCGDVLRRLYTSRKGQPSSPYAYPQRRSAAPEHVDRERQHAEVEHERRQALAERRPGACGASDLDVAGLERHAQREAEIDEVPVIGLVAARGNRARRRRFPSPSSTVEQMRVMQRVDRCWRTARRAPASRSPARSPTASLLPCSSSRHRDQDDDHRRRR